LSSSFFPSTTARGPRPCTGNAGSSNAFPSFSYYKRKKEILAVHVVTSERKKKRSKDPKRTHAAKNKQEVKQGFTRGVGFI
jgi:hypothetical protein